MRKSGNKWKRPVCALLAALLLFSLLPSLQGGAEAAGLRTFQLAQAQKLALRNSPEIAKIYNKIILQKAKYEESIKEIKAKIKNKKSFRWTPLLSFKFPEQFDLAEEYEINFKPLSIQVEISKLRHQLKDQEFAVLEKVNTEYVKVYILQEKIAFYEELLANAQTELARNQARLVTGDAKQSDIDSMQAKVEDLTQKLSELKRSFEKGKSNLQEMCKLDVSTGYRFKNPLKNFIVNRDQLNGLIQYTLANDQTVYEAKMAYSLANTTLNVYESLMRNQYGAKLNAVSAYVSMVRRGQEVDYAAFKTVYDKMLVEVDKPWSWKIRILFFSFAGEWFKGSISGTRYVEDDMYALYVACQEYEAARKELESARKDTTKLVSDSFESLITAKNSYLALANSLASARENLDKTIALNKLGLADFTEVSDMQKNYQDVQLEALDALAAYNELLISFDRLTCGAITKLMTGAGLEMDAGGTGDSYADKPYYNIVSKVEDMVFEFSLDIPEDFEPEISDFELWYEGTQIGERTPADKVLRHLCLDYGETGLLTVRLFNGEDFVAECEIDTTVPRDVLPVQGGVPAADTGERKAGTYTVSTTNLGNLSTSTLKLDLETGFGIKSYTLSYASAGDILVTKPLDVSESFTYLTLLVPSLEEVKVNLYDRDGELMYTGRFDTATQSVMVPAETGA